MAFDDLLRPLSEHCSKYFKQCLYPDFRRLTGTHWQAALCTFDEVIELTDADGCAHYEFTPAGDAVEYVFPPTSSEGVQLVDEIVMLSSVTGKRSATVAGFDARPAVKASGAWSGPSAGVPVYAPAHAHVSMPVTNVERFFTTVDNYIANTTSTTTGGDIEKANSLIPPEDAMPTVALLEKLLFVGTGITYDTILEQYREAFLRHKHLVTTWPDAAAMSTPNPFLEQIFGLLRAMIADMDPTWKDKYDVVPRKSQDDESSDGSDGSPRTPDFTFVMKPTDDTPTTLHQTLLPIVVKPLSNASVGIRQSVGFLLQRIKVQVELERDIGVRRHGFAVATDGNVLTVSYLECQDGEFVLHARQQLLEKHQMLWPLKGSRARNTLTLDFLPGLVFLISLLTSTPEQLGCVPSVSWAQHDEWVLQSVLGMGGFATAILGKLSAAADVDVVFKVPRYSNGFTVPAARHFALLVREQTVLQQIAGIECIVMYVPHVIAFHRDVPCLVFKEVGISMLEYVSHNRKTIDERRALCNDVETILKDVLTKIRIATGVTHRDIRPQNILVRMTGRGDEVTPMLIDWALSGDNEIKYDSLRSADFQHDDVRKHFGRPVDIAGRIAARDCKTSLTEYKLEYDLASLLFASTAIIYNYCEFAAPWNGSYREYYCKVRELMVADRMTQKYATLE